jgi:energy-coupling factor transport system permease protein
VSGDILAQVERRSVFTRLDFRSKLALLVVLTLVSFLWESPLLIGGLTLTVLTACLIAGIRVGYIRRILGVLLPFTLIMMVTQGLFGATLVSSRLESADLTPIVAAPESWWLIGGLTLWWEGIVYGGVIVLKTLTMTLLIPLVVLTTDVNAMVVSLVKLRMPYKIAFILSSTLRFFPLLLRRAESIIQAQRLRGLDLDRMGPIKHVSVYAKIAVPLILGAMVESQTLELVLQSKAFSGTGDRTYYRASELTALDYGALGALGLFLVGALVTYVAFGWGRFGGPI